MKRLLFTLLSILLYSGQIFAQVYSKQLVKKAESGDTYSMASLGYCYFTGDGVLQDYTKAIEWFKKAADKEDAYSLRMLGICYWHGYGVETNIETAAQYLVSAAEKQDIEATIQLAFIAMRGFNGQKNEEAAFEVFSKIAEANIPESENAYLGLGEYYFRKNNYTESAKWYQKFLDSGGKMTFEDIERWAKVKKNTSGQTNTAEDIVKEYFKKLNELFKSKSQSDLTAVKNMFGKCVFEDEIARIICSEMNLVTTQINTEVYFNYLTTQCKKNTFDFQIVDLIITDIGVCSVKFRPTGLSSEPFITNYHIDDGKIVRINEDTERKLKEKRKNR